MQTYLYKLAFDPRGDCMFTYLCSVGIFIFHVTFACFVTPDERQYESLRLTSTDPQAYHRSDKQPAFFAFPFTGTHKRGPLIPPTVIRASVYHH